MAFTYYLESHDAATLNLSKVRLEIGDTESGTGVKPGRANFTDAEIQMLIDRDGDVGRAAAGACEILARSWARVASAQAGTLRNDYNHVSEMWDKQAKQLREQYGGGGARGIVFTLDRADGYSEYADGET